MADKILHIGIVGLQPGRSWAAIAHLPGLHAQKDKFEVVGVANRSYESSVTAAESYNIPNAYHNVDELVNASEVDIVAVTVRVPHHKDVVTRALNAGKAMYCEWPLAKDLAEAEELTKLVAQKKVRTFIGTQAIASPHIQHLKELMADHYIGEILSHSLIGYGRIWGPEISDESSEKYLLDNNNGATMLSIPVAHTLAAVQFVFGSLREVNSVLATRRKKIYSHESKAWLDMTAPDQVGIQGLMEDGSVFSLHYRGGMPPDGNGFTWEINGTTGVLRITGLTGSIQIEALKIEACLEGEQGFTEVDVPAEMLALCPGEYIPGNVGRMYTALWNDIHNNTYIAPDFNDALELHRLLDRIERATL